MYIEKLRSDSTSETFLLKDQPESPAQDTLEQPFPSDAVAETKPEQEVPANAFIIWHIN